MAFFLSECGDKRKRHLGVFIEREDVFCLKENADRRVCCFKLPDVTDTIHDVSCKTGNAFCDNDIDLTGFAVIDHPDETVTVFQRCT